MAFIFWHLYQEKKKKKDNPSISKETFIEKTTRKLKEKNDNLDQKENERKKKKEEQNKSKGKKKKKELFVFRHLDGKSELYILSFFIFLLGLFVCLITSILSTTITISANVTPNYYSNSIRAEYFIEKIPVDLFEFIPEKNKTVFVKLKENEVGVYDVYKVFPGKSDETLKAKIVEIDDHFVQVEYEGLSHLFISNEVRNFVDIKNLKESQTLTFSYEVFMKKFSKLRNISTQ